MFDDSILSEPNMIIEIENPVRMRRITGTDDGIFVRPNAAEITVREYIYDMLMRAGASLPKGCHFMIIEAFRPLALQIKYWDEYMSKLRAEHPGMAQEKLDEMCNVYVHNPHTVGSGHQTGAAIDLTLSDDNGKEFDMGTDCNDYSSASSTDSPNISDTGKKNRKILKDAMESAGFANYPNEWWHYSFGERLWARIAGSKIAIFAKITE